MDIVIATHNKGKAFELKEILAGYGYNAVSLSELGIGDEVEETGETFKENALLKARFAYNKTGRLSLADDSGLEVEALNGAPGIYSSRYAENDKARINRLLKELNGIPAENRGARFVCALAVVSGDTEYAVCGTCDGRILTETVGAGGFGYDPVFFFEPMGKTFGQLTDIEKNEVSHRANALKKFESEILPKINK